MRKAEAVGACFAGAFLAGFGCAGGGGGADPGSPDPGPEAALDAADPGGEATRPDAAIPGIAVGGLWIEVEEDPPVLVFRDAEGRVVAPAAPGVTVLEVSRVPEGVDLPRCEPGRDPRDSDCWVAQADGRIAVAMRVGPGSLVFGAAVVGQQAWEVRVTGGPPDRRYRVAMFGSGPCVNP